MDFKAQTNFGELFGFLEYPQFKSKLYVTIDNFH